MPEVADLHIRAEFCWTELIVNAIAHRDYNITGTDIQIKMFDDHMTVESPGQLPGLVRPNNMREMHFSRNPKIIEFLHVYEYVKEFGEGVDRMYREMEDAGLPDPEYHVSSFMLCATLKIRSGLLRISRQDNSPLMMKLHTISRVRPHKLHIPIQPFAHVVANYSCYDRDNESLICRFLIPKASR